MKFRLFLTFSMLLILVSGVRAQQLEEKRRALEKIRTEITRFRQQLAATAAKEKSALQNLQELEHDISLHQKLLNKTISAERSVSRRIDRNVAEIGRLNKELEALQTAYTSRSVNLYKHGSSTPLDLLIDAPSVSRMMALRKYYKIISQRDKKRIGEIVRTAGKIASLNESLSRNLSEQRSLKRAAQKETAGLTAKKNDRKRLLESLGAEKNRVKLALEEREKAEKSLEAVIADMLTASPERTSSAVMAGFTDFTASKGRLPWPAPGRLVAHSGLERDPDTKTQTVNRGIDIQTEKDADVIAVCDGRVARIRWLPWFGQTLFVQHTSGYYTVYARLSEISVRLNDRVNAGQVIGKVGAEPVTSLAKLNFQIWKGSENLNPEEWLASEPQYRGNNIAQRKKNQ